MADDSSTLGFDEDDEHTVMLPSFGLGSFFAERYRIDTLLGSGAMGRVYAALEMYSGRRVALKILHKERLGEPETVERFQREAEVLASIGHPCIVEIYTFHRAGDGTPYLAMELLEGETLKARLSSAGPFRDPRELQGIVDCVCSALGAAHARGIVHRDMKPDNVFLPASGEPRAKLVDFGLSRMQAQDANLTQSGMILGTPRYMAPEQLRNAASVGPSVDLYSVGILIYEALTGSSPYPAQDYGQLLGCVMEGRTTPLTQIRPDLAVIEEVVSRAIDPDPQRRFGSSQELADAYAIAVGAPSRRAAIPARPRSEARRTPSAGAISLVDGRGSTLAFDASVLGSLPDLSEVAPGATPEPAPSFGAQPAQPSAKGGDTLFLSGDVPPPGAPGYTPAPFGQGSPVPFGQGSPVPFGQGSPVPFGQASPVPFGQGSAVPFGQGSAVPFGQGSAVPFGQGSAAPSSAPGSPDPYAAPARASHLPSPHAAPVYGSHPPGTAPSGFGSHPSGPPPSGFGSHPAGHHASAPSFSGTPSASPGHARPSASSFSQPPPPKRAKKGRGLLLFGVAMVLMILFSATAGLAIRAYVRGDVRLPGIGGR